MITKARIKNLIWIQTAYLGDIVLTTGGIHLAAQKFPGIRQFLLTTTIGKQALSAQTSLTDILVLDKSTSNIFKTFAAVKKNLAQWQLLGQETIILQPHTSYRSSLLARYLGFKTITFTDTNFSFLAAKKVPRNLHTHAAVRMASLLSPLQVRAEDINKAKPYLEKKNATQNVPHSLQKFAGNIVIIAPGSQWETKMWPISNYKKLIELIFTHFAVGVVILGSKREKYLSKTLDASFAGQKTYWNLIGHTSPADLSYLVPKGKLIITNDNAISHYGSAFNVTTITIFGATVPRFGFTPLAQGSEIIETTLSLDCRPCGLHGHKICPRRHFQCMLSIDTQRVFQAAARVLERA